MGFSSFLGRVLFASFFILTAWQTFNEFGEDGGPMSMELKPKLAKIENHISSALGVAVPSIDVKHVVAGGIILKGLGGILFVFSSPLGAYLLILYIAVTSPVLYDFYNYDRVDDTHTVLLGSFLQNIGYLGALLFFIGLKNKIPKRQLKKKTHKAKAS